jgi:hypothetical protein
MAATFLEDRTYGFFINTNALFGEIENLANPSGEVKCDVLSKYIDSVELLPPKNTSEFMVFVDEEGLVSQKPRNELAAFVLDYLGFDLGACLDQQIFGDVVIISCDDKGLTKEQVGQLSRVCEWFQYNDEHPSPSDLKTDKH